jgi:hypothetical protein
MPRSTRSARDAVLRVHIDAIEATVRRLLVLLERAPAAPYPIAAGVAILRLLDSLRVGLGLERGFTERPEPEEPGHD